MKSNKLWRILFLLLTVMSSCGQEEYLTIETKDSKDYPNIVSLEDARIELEKLLCDVYQSQSSKSMQVGMSKKNIANAFTIKNETSFTRSSYAESPIIHVFNFEDKEGFAIMSGNVGLPSLLALADSGEITETGYIDNPGFALFLENMEKKYEEYLSEVPLVVSSNNYKVYGEWKNFIYKQNGYCKVKWNQDSPYNNYCPLKDGKRTVTGCVATAVAQLMSIYGYPTSYKGYSFDWNEMTKNKYAWNCTSTAQDQIAHLMVELGTKSNLDMSYNLSEKGGSGANANNIPRTLKNFGYSSGGSIKGYNTASVVSELKGGYGVLVGGFSHKSVKKFLGIKVKTKYSGGHRWLCHGLLERRRTVKTYNNNGILQSSTIESEWHPLCNWGWGGYQDGYYLSSAFNSNNGPSYPDATKNSSNETGSEDYNYQFKITALIGARK